MSSSRILSSASWYSITVQVCPGVTPAPPTWPAALWPPDVAGVAGAPRPGCGPPRRNGRQRRLGLRCAGQLAQQPAGVLARLRFLAEPALLIRRSRVAAAPEEEEERDQHAHDDQSHAAARRAAGAARYVEAAARPTETAARGAPAASTTTATRRRRRRIVALRRLGPLALRGIAVAAPPAARPYRAVRIVAHQQPAAAVSGGRSGCRSPSRGRCAGSQFDIEWIKGFQHDRDCLSPRSLSSLNGTTRGYSIILFLRKTWPEDKKPVAEPLRE